VVSEMEGDVKEEKEGGEEILLTVVLIG